MLLFIFQALQTKHLSQNTENRFILLRTKRFSAVKNIPYKLLKLTRIGSEYAYTVLPFSSV